MKLVVERKALDKDNISFLFELSSVNNVIFSTKVKKLLDKGFIPDSKGYLHRGTTYITESNGFYHLTKFSSIWHNGVPVREDINVLHILD